MLVSMFVMYATSSHVGSPGRMWELLMAASEIRPVEGNAEGQLLTMKSVYGGLVGLTFLGGGFSATVDSQYAYTHLFPSLAHSLTHGSRLFQKAIAADPKSTVAGYLLGALCWVRLSHVSPSWILRLTRAM
jgi:Na+/proline symporter